MEHCAVRQRKGVLRHVPAVDAHARHAVDDILAYAQSMLDNGVPAGVLMIDDTWQAGYGDWRFSFCETKPR